jgi:hypothetical protein
MGWGLSFGAEGVAVAQVGCDCSSGEGVDGCDDVGRGFVWSVGRYRGRQKYALSWAFRLSSQLLS